MGYSSKVLLGPLLIASLAGCIIDSGERTVDTGATSTAVIERAATLDSSSEAVAGCVAQPSTWAAPAVQLTGSAQEGDASVEFDVTPAEFPDGVAHLNTTRKMNAYTWFCYKDATREYTDGDTVKVRISFSVDSDQATVFTTVGSEDGYDSEPAEYELYYMNMAAHRIITDNTSGNHLIKQTASFSDESFEANSHSFERFEVGDYVYFTSRTGFALRTQLDGDFQVLNIPSYTKLKYVNGKFVAFNSTFIDLVSSVQIKYSSDMITWSEEFDISIVGSDTNDVFYDHRESEYVLFNKGSRSGQTKGYYTSSNLESWSHNTVGSYQNFNAIFTEDGRALMASSATSSPLMIRTDGGEWEDFTGLPGVDSNHWIFDFILLKDRVHVLLKEYVGGDTSILNIHHGYSDDMVNWTWNEITSTESEVDEIANITALSDQEIAVYGGEYIYLSTDNGESWTPKSIGVNALNLDQSVDQTLLEANIESIFSFNNLHYGKIRYRDAVGSFAELYFSTSDYSEISLVAMAQDIDLFTFNESLYLVDSMQSLKWNIYKEEMLTAVSGTTAKKKSSGTLTYNILFLLIGFLGFRFKRNV